MFSNLIVPLLCAAALPQSAIAAATSPFATQAAPARAEAPSAPAAATAARAPDARELATALQRGIALLLARQEDYDPAAERGQPPAKGRASKDDAPRGKDAKKDDAPAPEDPANPDPQSKREPATGEAKDQPREWPYEGVYRVGGEIPIGYRIGGTSIAASALITAQDGKLTAESAASVRRALDFVLEGLEHPLMTKEFEQGYDVRGWGHAYGLSFLLLLRDQKLVPKELAERVDGEIKTLVTLLQETEIESGGWNYSRPNGSHRATAADGATKPNAKKGGALSSPSTFMTAPTLQILFEAARQGENVDAGVVERGLKTLEDARLDTGAFQYGTNKAGQNGKGFEDVPGAIGRMTVCETTLYLAGRGSVARIQKALDAFFEHWEWLEKRRKQNGTHVAPYYIAPYYFFYAHRFVAQGIEFLPEKDRAAYREKLYALLWKVREEDGGWNDRVFPRSESFGTAMTLFALHEPVARRPAGWKTGSTKEAK